MMCTPYKTDVCERDDLRQPQAIVNKMIDKRWLSGKRVVVVDRRRITRDDEGILYC